MNYLKALLYLGSALAMLPVILVGWVVGVTVLSFRAGMVNGEFFMLNKGHVEVEAWKSKFAEDPADTGGH